MYINIINIESDTFGGQRTNQNGVSTNNVMYIHHSSFKGMFPKQNRWARSYQRLCCLNTRSIKNKSADLTCHASSTGPNIFAITESGLSERDVAHKAEIMRPGYKLFEHQRVRRKGGGIARLLNETVDGRKVDSGEHRSFEFG